MSPRSNSRAEPKARAIRPDAPMNVPVDAPPVDESIAAPILCFVTDRNSLRVPPPQTSGALLEKIESAAVAGVDWIQIREKDLLAKDCAELVRQALYRAQRATQSRNAGARVPDRVLARILVNDRLDIAIAEGAGGTHFGESSLPPSAIQQVRQLLAARPPLGARNFVLGFSCHSLESAQAAATAGADYIFFGPIFATPSKAAFGQPQGLDRLAEVCRKCSVPVVAIGGITLRNASDCVRVGARGIAAIRLFQEAEDLRTIVANLRTSLQAAP